MVGWLESLSNAWQCVITRCRTTEPWGEGRCGWVGWGRCGKVWLN